MECQPRATKRSGTQITLSWTFYYLPGATESCDIPVSNWWREMVTVDPAVTRYRETEHSHSIATIFYWL
jgi:hypothetical protein